MAMIPAAKPAERIGYLLFNPGGPGGSAVDELSDGASADFWRGIEAHHYFDIVGPDPRGVGHSTPVQCDPEIWNKRVTQFPQTETEYIALVETYKAAGESCAEKSGDLLNFVDTASAARDIEAIRLALGDEPLSYIGMSYGTQLGSQYAELFPENIRAMVLDGNLDHTQDEVYALTTEVDGFEKTLDQFFKWCAEDTSCELYNETNLPSKFDAFISTANSHSIPAPACVTNSSAPQCYPDATGYEMLRVIQSALVFPNGELGAPGWSGLSVLLQEAMSGDASHLSLPLIPLTDTSSADYSYVAVICQDWNRTAWSYNSYKTKIQMGKIISPHTLGQGEFWYLQARCQDWPAKVANGPYDMREVWKERRLETKLLMVNAFWDPETPFQWAVNLQRQFGEHNAVLLQRNGSGHTSWYRMDGEMHVLINDYLIRLQTPGEGTVTVS